MSSRAASKAPAFDNASKTLAFGSASDLNDITDLENLVGGDFVSSFDLIFFFNFYFS